VISPAGPGLLVLDSGVGRPVAWPVGILLPEAARWLS
jgi:hypothetical protein